MRSTIARPHPRRLTLAGLVALLAAATAPAPAAADEADPVRGHVFAGIDWALVYGDESSLGGGPGFNGGVVVWPTDRIGIEGRITHVTHERDFGSGNSFSGNQTWVGLSVLYAFGRHPRGREWVSVGIGMLHYDRGSSFVLDENGAIERFDYRATEAQGQIGFGADIEVGKRLVIRPELRVTPLALFSTGVSLGYRF